MTRVQRLETYARNHQYQRPAMSTHSLARELPNGYEPSGANDYKRDRLDAIWGITNVPAMKTWPLESAIQVIERCRALDLDPYRLASNKLIHVIQGEVVLATRLLMLLIRQSGHRMDILFNDGQTCELRGVRKDCGSELSLVFTFDLAQRAGITHNGNKLKHTWAKFPMQMLLNAAIGLMARQLFPDILGTIYVEGEIDEDSPSLAPQQPTEADLCDEEHLQHVMGLLMQVDEKFRAPVVKRFGEDLSSMPADKYQSVVDFLMQHIPNQEEENDENATEAAEGSNG